MKIKVFAFQKDEDDILRDWIAYHSYLFGKENIYIIDHDSKDSKSIITNSGANLLHFSGPFVHNKGIQLTKVMNDNKNSCDFVIPLDVDEFLMTQDGGVEKEDVLECFKDLKGCGAYKIVSYSIPGHDKDPLTEFTSVRDNPDHGRLRRWKTFWRSKNFVRTDQGNHGWEEGPYEKTKLGMLHFHDRGFEHYKRKFLRWPKAYGVVGDQLQGGAHWYEQWEVIKDMNNKEMFEHWKKTIIAPKNNVSKYESFMFKIKELRKLRGKQ